jgi:hypothetical protein
LYPDQLGKRVGQLRWEELELQFRLPLHRTVYDWIAASWRREYKPRTVRITAFDPELNVLRRREFPGALITETTVSALDASLSELGLLKLKLMPETVQTISPGGRVLAPKPPVSWLGAKFRLDLPELDCTRVLKIDSFTVKQPFAVKLTDTGQVTAPGPLSFPNLTVTLPENSAATWQAWFNNLVVEGHSGDAEKTGRLSLLDPQLRERVRIGLFNVGIFRLTSSPWTPDDSPRRVVAGLYCERMDFTVFL